MRIVTGTVFVLMMAAQPASANEAFIVQVANKAVASEPAAIASAKSALTSAMLALPVKPGGFGLPAETPAAVPGTNASLVVQSGVNNFAAVSQTGGASTILQHGNGNQAVVTQHNPH